MCFYNQFKQDILTLISDHKLLINTFNKFGMHLTKILSFLISASFLGNGNCKYVHYRHRKRIFVKMLAFLHLIVIDSLFL
jgi:hypothetical protein